MTIETIKQLWEKGMFIVFLRNIQHQLTTFFKSFDVWSSTNTFREKSVLWQLALQPVPLEGMSGKTISCDIYVMGNQIILKDDKIEIPDRVLVRWEIALSAESVIDSENGTRFVRIPNNGYRALTKICFLKDTAEFFGFIFKPTLCWEGEGAPEAVAEFERLVAV
ncbi:hypothetical protein IIB50_01580 [Patescibacteria group bacterium]|nr:hypothetical protein [Patescibacteria group bacterium]